MIKLSDYVIEFLANAGLKHIFLLPGGGAMHLVDSVGKCDRIEYVCNLHEQACAIAADAYGQYTNRFGAALVTTGPGGTNTLTGVAAAWLDSTPCLFISGQVKRADIVGTRGVRQIGFQEIDIVRVVSPITKYAVTVMDPQTIRYHLEKALLLATSGRPGPVWLDIPLDVQAAQIDPGELAGLTPAELAQPDEAEQLSAAVARTIELLNGSERPCILAGNGVRLAGALLEFQQLIEWLQVPVLTSWKAIDFLPESHPLYAGRPGSVGQRGANFTLQNADFVLALGARLDYGQTGYNPRTFARAARKVIVDIDPAEVAKLGPVDVAAVCDARAFLAGFLSRKQRVAAGGREAWRARVRDWKDRYPVVLPEYWEQPDRVNNYVLVQVLGEEMAAGDLLVPGSSGACSEITMQAFPVKEGMRIFNSEGLGPMGFALAAALGACVASGGRRTVTIDGDGGFQMNSQELETVRRLNLPIKIFVLNNNGYGSIRATQRTYFQSRFVASHPSGGLTLPDTLRIAAAYGIAGRRIADHAGLREAVREVLDSPGPMVCEVMISPEQFTAPRVSSAQRADGSMVSKPMEDMWPFLERDEFAANMLIPTLES
ncbi:MAG TPA: thiamine pyrophosphate-binding protein [Bryobacteraceae bacterium]|nr:thiamine pyrophosphate-binding protein [Bryobacteraceae bacterium]